MMPDARRLPFRPLHQRRGWLRRPSSKVTSPSCPMRVFHGAILASAGAELIIGPHTIVREGAVIRATATHPCRIGRHCLVSPNTHVVGAEIGDEVFIATGATLLHGCRLGRGVEVRLNGVVHIRTVLPQDAVVPIGWVAVGDPAQLFPPSDHNAIWAIQEPLDFPGFVY